MPRMAGDSIHLHSRSVEPRIVSLIASSTEILCALGLESHLVGRSHECDFPPSIVGLPVCTEAKLDQRLSSAEIDRSVRGILEQALSVYRVDAEKLRNLRPTHIVTQTQCEVCAVSLRDVEGALGDWIGTIPKVVSLQGADLPGVLADIERVAENLSVPEHGRDLVAQMRDRMSDIQAHAATLQARPTVGCIEWIEPLMASGNWMPELVAMAGGVNLFGSAGRHAPGLAWETLRSADPDVVVVLPCGFDLARTYGEMRALATLPGWNDLHAVRAGRVYACDGNAFFNRPGPRLVESLEVLAEILHPEAFTFGHRGIAWKRW